MHYVYDGFINSYQFIICRWHLITELCKWLFFEVNKFFIRDGYTDLFIIQYHEVCTYM